MPEIELGNLRDGYVDLVHWVRREGEFVSPRGLSTREVQGALIRLEDPYDALPFGVGRGVSKGIAAVEACQLMGGVSTPHLVIDIGPIFANYTEDNGEFHGAYGPRTQGQFVKAIERLSQDPDTRQAVVTIWNKELDLLPDKRDYPCTLLFVFHVRDGRLNMRTHMRSNDVMKGVAYDFFQFTRVQIAMASILGVPVGQYFHYADSLHLYDSDADAVQRLHSADPQERMEDVPALTGETWLDVSRDARQCLTVAENEDMKAPITNEQAWYAAAMMSAKRRNHARVGAHV